MSDRLREVFTASARLLEDLTRRCGPQNPVFERDFYAIGDRVFGFCEHCAAWPGEPHHERAEVCPSAGSTFSGDWADEEVRIVRRCADALDELAWWVADDDWPRLVRFVRITIRDLQEAARGLDDVDGSRLPPEAHRPTPNGPEVQR